MDEWSRAPPQSPREEVAAEDVRVRISEEFIRFLTISGAVCMARKNGKKSQQHVDPKRNSVH